jgi:hypothetical protein
MKTDARQMRWVLCATLLIAGFALAFFADNGGIGVSWSRWGGVVLLGLAALVRPTRQSGEGNFPFRSTK